MKIGKEDYYDINTIDSKTKFVVEEEFMHSRTQKIIADYFKRIKTLFTTKFLSDTIKKNTIQPRKGSSLLL